jgi:hypothetical protein
MATGDSNFRQAAPPLAGHFFLHFLITGCCEFLAGFFRRDSFLGVALTAEAGSGSVYNNRIKEV